MNILSTLSALLHMYILTRAIWFSYVVSIVRGYIHSTHILQCVNVNNYGQNLSFPLPKL